MRLDNLYKIKSLLSEAEDTGQPLEPSRYPAIRRHALAKYEPAIDIEKELESLKDMAYAYPPPWLFGGEGRKAGGVKPPDYEEAVKAYRRAQAAFRKLLQKLQLNPMSGLRGESEYQRLSALAQQSSAKRVKFGGTGPGEYIVVAADVDNMKYLNDKTGLGHAGVNSILQNIGDLFKRYFQIENTKLFHPHGDEFRVISYLGGTADPKLRFARLVEGCIGVSDALASTGFYVEGWEDQRRVQPTISFGISTTDTAADGLLTHVKTGASSGKEMKYVIVVDRDLRYDLGLNPEEMNKYIQSLRRQSDSAQVVALDSPEVAAYDSGVSESKVPMDEVRKKPGAVVLEASWSEITPHRKKELEAVRRQKRAYLEQPGGVMKVGKNYYPLKEPYKPSQ